MKRIIAILFALALVLVLAACSQPIEKNAQSVTDTPEATNVVQADATQTEPQDVSFQLESLPDIGSYSSNTTVDRWYSTYQDYLTVRNDYGVLVPYIGAVQDYGDSYQLKNGEPDTSFRYGLMTVNGKIVVDAVYKWVSTETAPNGDTFYSLSVYDQTSVPASQINEEELGERRSSFLIDIKGTKILEIPYSHYYTFVKDRIVLVPAYETDKNSEWYDCVAVYDMDFNLITKLSNTAMSGYPTTEGGAPVMRCGCLNFYNEEGHRFYDLAGNQILRNEKSIYNAQEFGDYILLNFKDETQKLVDISGKDCMPTVHKGMTVEWVEGETLVDERILCVEKENGFQCYDDALHPVGSVHDEEPELIMLFDKLCYLSQDSDADALTYCELATDKLIDWSAYTKLDMSKYAPDYERFSTPSVIGDRFFLYEYNRDSDDGNSAWYRDVIDLQNGKMIIQTMNHQWWNFADRWLLLKDYDGACDDYLLDLQTQTITLCKSFLYVYEVGGETYCVGIRNGYSFVKNLDTEENLLRMFVTTVG